MHAWQWKGEWGSDERGVRVRRKGSEGQTKGEWGSDERGVRVRRNCNVFNLAMENVLKGLPDKIWENVLKGLPDKIWDQLSRDHTQIHFCKVHIYESLSNCEIVEMIKVSCIHKNDAELFFNVWHQLTKFSETG